MTVSEVSQPRGKEVIHGRSRATTLTVDPFGLPGTQRWQDARSTDPRPDIASEWRNFSRVRSLSSQRGDDDSTAAKQGCDMKGLETGG